ncbi:MAG TPA: sigma 54-interacting transcriptional regulator [bacterium]|nr:sigma 54-interacting transcriptional regulator [bacterium]
MCAWTSLTALTSGGMGEVFDAISPEGRRVALKLLPKGRSSAVFAHEVRVLTRLQNPSLVPVLGFATDSREIFGDDRGPAYWMEFVDGDGILNAARGAGAEKILHWFLEGLDALDALHTQGLLHGDLSPSNLLIDREGRLRLVDLSIGFGDEARLEMATLPYMAPERIDGHRLPSGDLFSYATVFYEALAGRHPRLGCRSLRDFLERPADPFLESAPAFAAAHPLAARVIERMLAVSPSERFSGAREIRNALQTGRSDGAAALSEFHPARMIGAEDAWKKIQDALSRAAASSSPLLLAVHGPSGSGKSRFAREVSLEGRLRDVPVEVFDGAEFLAPDELSRLYHRLREPKPGLVLVTWSDDAQPEPFARLVRELLKNPETIDVALRDLDGAETESLIALAFGPRAAAEAAATLFEDTAGNPARLVERIRFLAQKKLVREGRLAGEWRSFLRDQASRERPLDDRFVPPSLIRAVASGDADAAGPEAREIAEDLRRRRRYAPALALVERVLPLVSKPDEKSRLLRMRTNLLNDLGRREEALTSCEDWFHLRAGDETDAVRTAKYWLVTGQACQNLGRSDEAIERLKTGVGLPDERGTRPFRLKALSLLGLEELRRGRLPEAVACLEKIGVSDAAPALKAEALRTLATLRSRGGDWEAARRLLGEARALYASEHHLEGLFWTSLEEGNLALDHGKIEPAASAYAAAEGFAREAGSDLRQAVAHNNQGVLERARGHLAASWESLRRAGDVLRFIGGIEEWIQNRKELAVTEASLGRFAKAAEALKEMEAAGPNGRALAAETSKRLAALRDGTDALPADVLQRIYESLPTEFQVTFVERGDWKNRSAVPAEKKPKGDSPMTQVLPILMELNQSLLKEDDMQRVLERLMDSAMRIAGAENGFLVLRSDVPNGPIPGFDIAVARNVAKEDLGTDLYSFSLSAVRRALQTGDAVVTDNAMIDPAFREAKSVQLLQLKSILALPVTGPDGVLGVFYLDHRFQKGLFEGEILDVLKAFAGIAALALQKAKMIEGLKKRNTEMEVKIGEQEGEVQNLQKEVNRTRMILKKEYGDIVGRSPKMVEVLSVVDRITDAKIPVWIYGESGTGKEAIARALHFNSGRSKKAFVTENCSALPESLLESELFGHKKGAFTHAVSDKKGLLQYADGGTVFLDEIADMSLNLQAKLLRFLQEGEVRPIGAAEPVRVDARVVSASNKDLRALVAEGKFREDLFYRLNGITVKLPPLRERLEDLPLLAEHFLKRIGGRESKTPVKLEPGVLRIFMGYAWPGNIRELQNTLETAVLFAEKGTITRASLSFKPALFEGGTSSPSFSGSGGSASVAVSKDSLPPIVTETLKALRDQCYHKGKAAKALGISRRSLYARLERAGIDPGAASLKEMIEKALG